jgi:hypothetical protein
VACAADHDRAGVREAVGHGVHGRDPVAPSRSAPTTSTGHRHAAQRPDSSGSPASGRPAPKPSSARGLICASALAACACVRSSQRP